MNTGVRSSRTLLRLIALLTAAGVWMTPESIAWGQDSSARRVLETADVHGGLVVHLGCGHGRLTAALGVDDSYLVHGLDADTADVAGARAHIQSLGQYGDVSVDRLTGARLPYVDNLAQLVVVEELGQVAMDEVMRVLAPGGVACVRKGDRWERTVKPRADDTDEWTHYLHDSTGNMVAADKRVGPPKSIRWAAGPLWSRSHEFNPSLNALVSADGRMFYILDEGMLGLPDLRFPARWALYARDAYSGKRLWKRPVPNWGYRQWNTRGMWSAPLTLNRRVVTDGPRVYVTLGYNAPVTVIDAATGATIRTIPDSDGTDEMILHDGMLLLCVRDKLSIAAPPETKPKRRRNPHEWNIDAPGPATLVAVEVESGRRLWKTEPQTVGVLTLAADDDSICFHSDDQVVCLDRRSGDRRWASPARRQGGSRHAAGTLVMHDGVVLFTSRDGVKAFATRNGKELWTGPTSSGPGVTHPPDLFVAAGLVWGGYPAGSHYRDRTAVWREGRNLRNGKVERTVAVGHLISPLHHFRCYRTKATDRYLMLTKRGVEFLDLKGDDHMRHDWLRAMCHYGFVPANGMLYVPPHHCFCYPGVKLTGFLALAAETGGPEGGADKGSRLERGPAYGKTRGATSDRPDTADWPTYRRDASRSGYTRTGVSTDLTPAWDVDLDGRITQPTAVDGKLYVARIDAHEVRCLDAGDGETVWTYTAGARVDSPPTVHDGLVLFGCRDGWVYCLRAADGVLVWRFRAAPDERRIVAFEQIESPWPVPGSALVLDGVAYVSAGRSSFLDGGVYLCGLDPRTGRLLYETRVDGPWPKVREEVGRPFDMEGTKSDILVTDGEHIYLYQMVFDKQLNDVTPPRTSSLGDRVVGRHLMATGGFLQDIWYDRTYWTYSNRWPGFYYANSAPKAGQILVFDEETTYGLHVFTDRLRLSPAFTPGDEGYELFADDNDNEPVLADNSIGREKGPGYSRAAPPRWSHRIPLRAEAMVLADDKLFMAGTPDVVPEDDPYAGLEGRRGAQLWVVAADDGRKLAEYPLDERPAFDGLIAAAGRLYLATADGTLHCFASH